MTRTETQLRDSIASLRRAAINTRASQQAGWLTSAMDLERIRGEREAELAELLAARAHDTPSISR